VRLACDFLSSPSADLLLQVAPLLNSHGVRLLGKKLTDFSQITVFRDLVTQVRCVVNEREFRLFALNNLEKVMKDRD